MRIGSVALLALLPLLAGCRPPPVLGFVRPLTGDDAMYGRSADQGFQLALDEAENAGRLPPGFSLIEGDSGSTVAGTTEQVSLLFDQGARLIVGGITAEEASAMLPLLTEHDLPGISPSAGWPSPERSGVPLFRLWPTLDLQARTAAYYLREKLGLVRLLVVVDGSPSARVLEAELRQQFTLNLKGRVIGTVQVGALGWEDDLVDQWHAGDPQAVFIATRGESLVQTLEHLEQQGLRAVRVCGMSATVQPLLEEHAGLLENVIFAMPAYDGAKPGSPLAELGVKYRARFGHDPDPYAAHAYDAARLAIEALATARAAYRHELTAAIRGAAQEFPGASGVITFNDYGEVRRWPVMHCIRDGRVLTCREALEADVERAREELVRFLERSGSQRR